MRAHSTTLAWLGWLVACFAGLYQFLLQTSTSVMIPDLEKSFSIDSLGVSLLSSSYFYTYLICQIPAGILIDYFKPRRTVFISQLLLAVFCFVFATSTNVTLATISRILMGIVCAPTFIAAFYLIARTLPGKYFTIVAGFTETMAMVGGMLGQSLLARSVIQYGWRRSIIFLALVAFVMSLLAGLVMRDDLIHQDVNYPKPSVRQIWQDLLTMFALPQAWINGLFCGLVFGVIAAFGAFWSVTFLMKLYNISLSQAADASAMIFVGTAIGAPVVGWLSDYLQARRLLMIIFTFCALIVFSLIAYVPLVPVSWMFILILLLGFFSAVYLLPFAVIRDITPPHMRGSAMGYINMMCILLGAPVLQPLIGACLHAHNELNVRAYQDALMIIPISLILAMVLAFFVQERKNGV